MKSYHPCPSSWLGPLFFAAAFLFCGCVSTPFKIDPTKAYQLDMIVQVDGILYEGMGVLPDKPTGNYDFLVEARGDLDLFSLSTCSKELNTEKAWNVETRVPFLLFWNRKLADKRKFHFQYSRDHLERALSVCQIQLEGLNEKEGRHSWARFDIQDSKTTLPAYVTCNLEHKQYPGVSVCKNQEAKWMEIVFEEDVIGQENSERCKLPGELHGKLFRFQIKPKFCIYNFIGVKSGNVHRLTTHGREDFLLRN